MNIYSIIKWSSGAALSLSLLACSHTIKKSAITTTPEQTLFSLKQQLGLAYDKQADVLAPNDFNSAKELLDEAIDEFREDEMELDEFKEAAGYSKAYLDRAILKANKRYPVIKPIADARSRAIDVGASMIVPTEKKFNAVDEDFREASSNFKNELTPPEYSALQKRYLELEIKAVQFNELSQVKNIIESAKNNSAEDLAPKSYLNAKRSFNVAENLIAINPRTPSEFLTERDYAITKAIMLQDVMDTIRSREGEMKESVAIEMVRNNKKLVNQSDRIAFLRNNYFYSQSKLANLDSILADKEESLIRKSKTLANTQKKVNFQKTIDNIREQFNEDEAEVYQQGNMLIIRLKDIDFGVGKHKVPTTSEDLLTKVSGIVSKVNADRVIIEGHTDSTGERKYNKWLSKKRAETVADFLDEKVKNSDVTTRGLGETRPLSSNTTKNGRALNRRVDIKIISNS